MQEVWTAWMEWGEKYYECIFINRLAENGAGIDRE
jgi:hypothetical protein